MDTIYLLLTNGFRNFSFFFFSLFQCISSFLFHPWKLSRRRLYPRHRWIPWNYVWFLYCTLQVRKLTLSYISHDKALPFVIDDLFLLIRSGMLIAKTLNRLFADISVFSIWIVLVPSSVFCPLERSINAFSCFTIEGGG